MRSSDDGDLAVQARRRTRRFLLTLSLSMLAVVASMICVGAAFRWATAPSDEPHPTVTSRDTGTDAPESSLPPRPSGGSDIRWVQVGGMRLPVSDHDGPTDMNSGRARGFSRTPAGAALAAVNLTARVSPHVGPAVFTPTITEQVIGIDKNAFAASVAADYQRLWQKETVPAGAPLPTFGRVLGYRIDAVTDTAAAVHVLMAGPRPGGGSLTMDFRTDLAWADGDWRLIAPPNGQWLAVATHITDTAGYKLFDQGR